MSINGPPSPASFAGSDWGSGPRGNPPPKAGSPGPNGFPGGGGGGRANLPTPPVSGSSHGSMMSGGPPPPGPGGPMGPGPMGPGSMGPGPMGGPPPRGDSRGPGGGPGHPSPPQSLGRLSTSSNLSMRDPEAARRRQMMMEDMLLQHYQVLRTYLASDLRKDPEGRSKKARDKLLRLSPIQFHELSTDIFDELRRRQNQHRAPPNAPNFLTPKENFHPKRNQARSKLSTLPEGRFRDLATDVFFELERRFPRFSGRPPPNGAGPNGMGPPSRTGTPMGYRGHHPRQDSLASAIMSPDGYGRSTQGNTIVPNKSYLVEDDDDGDVDSIYGGGKRDTTATNRSFGSGKVIAEFQTKIDDLEGKVTALETQLKEKDDELEAQKANGVSGEDAEELTKSLEDKLSSAQALNRNLQEEIDSVRLEHDHAREEVEELGRHSTELVALRAQHDSLLGDHSDLRGAHQDLQQQHDSLQRQLKESSGGGEWRVRCEDLEGENQKLRQSVQDQQRMTKDVKAEASGFLAEMKALIIQTNNNSQREERLNQRNSQLEAEIQEWKDRYARTKAQLQDTKTASLGLEGQQQKMGQNLRAQNGLISEVDINKFQVGIDEVLRTARSGETHLVLEKIKGVVTAVRPMIRSTANITDVKAIKARNKLTATVNNFITAGRNFTQAGGISPVSLLDAAASHLSSAIVELAAIVKIRSGEAGDDNNLPLATHQPPQLSSPAEPMPLSRMEQPALAPIQPPAQQPVSLPVQQPMSSPVAPSKPQPMLQPATYQHGQHYDDDDDNDDDDEDEDDDPTAGYYNDTPVNGTPLNEYPAEVETAGELLPSTTYQLPSTTYQPQAVPSRKPVGGVPAPAVNGHANEPDLEELKEFLSDQTSVLIASIQSLVTSIRGAAPATEVHSRLTTIIETSGAILQRSSDAVASSSNVALKSQAAPLVSTLEQSFSKLQAKESEGQSVAEGTPEWKKWCQGVPPIAFEIARFVKELGGKVKAVSSEGDDDFS